MKIAINDHRKIFAVQKDFATLFPHLKIEFLSKSRNLGNSQSEKLVHPSSKTLGDCRLVHNKGELTLTPNMTVSDLQQSLSDTYGIAISVFLKSGNDWIETKENGKLSLEEQDKKALFTNDLCKTICR